MPEAKEALPMLKRIYHHLDEHIETYFGSIVLAVFASLVVVQVVMRYIFSSPIIWSDEIARYALVWFVYFAGSYAVLHERHVKFNVLVDLLGKKVPIAQRIIRICVLLMWLAFLLFMLHMSSQSVIRQYDTGQVSPATQTPMYLIYLGIPIGMALMAFRVIQHTVRASVDIVKNPHAPVRPTHIEAE